MTTRRLAAILAADVAGFSAMMERDEEGTAARIRALRKKVDSGGIPRPSRPLNGCTYQGRPRVKHFAANKPFASVQGNPRRVLVGRFPIQAP